MATLKEKINSVIKQYPKGIKAREIAIQIGVTKTEVNSFLYSHKSEYSVDENYQWVINKKSISFGKIAPKVKDERHDTSNVRAINAELKRQRLERKKQEEQKIELEPVETLEEDEEFYVSDFLENCNPTPKVHSFLPAEEPKKHTNTPLCFDDIYITCRSCGKKFKLSQGEIDFYKNKGLCLPTHCRECLDSGIAGIEDIRNIYGIRPISNFGYIPRKFGGPKN